MNAAPARVLIIDDYPQILRFIDVCLRSHGYEVVTASSGEQGLEILRTAPPDIILLDIRMPDMNGFEFMEQARQIGSWPVVAYSATPEYAGQALASGAYTFLRKPLDLQHLTAVLAELIPAGD
jgi:two-component system KDP operon response regulator KdpE